MSHTFTRDKKTGTLINANMDAYNKILADRKKHKELVTMKRDIDNLKKNVQKIIDHLNLGSTNG